MTNRLTAILIAILMPLLLFRWFTPTLAWQLDFWALWFLAMLLVGLPLLYAEGAMAARSGLISNTLPVIGIQALTREADKSVLWRSFAWLGALLVGLVALLSVDSASQVSLTALSQLGLTLEVPAFALAGVVAVLVGILSLIGRKLLVPAVVLVVFGLVVGVVQGILQHTPTFNLQVTSISLYEWAVAVLLALVCVGAGTGLYWYTYSHDGDEKPNMTQKVMPIWIAQLIVGIVLLSVSNLSITALYQQPPVSALLFSVGVMLAAAYLTHVASIQLATMFKKFGIWVATLITTFCLALLAVFTEPEVQVILVVIVSLICALELAIFSGWKMKISHLRKTLNFASEARYNVWRVMVRLVTPICIVLALIAILLGWIS